MVLADSLQLPQGLRCAHQRRRPSTRLAARSGVQSPPAGVAKECRRRFDQQWKHNRKAVEAQQKGSGSTAERRWNNTRKAVPLSDLRDERAAAVVSFDKNRVRAGRRVHPAVPSRGGKAAG